MVRAATITGVGPVANRDDAVERLSLLLPGLGLQRELAQFKAERVFIDELIEALVRTGNTPAADACIRRFATIEADVSMAQFKGLGRGTAYKFPRLGGALHGKVSPGSSAAATLQAAVERTIHAGYLAVLTERGSTAPIVVVTAEELWSAFIPVSYDLPEHLRNIALDLCAFDAFWFAVLERCGLGKDVKDWKSGRPSQIRQSIGGLCSVGVALALAERGPAKP
jgi:hypothetical protein